MSSTVPILGYWNQRGLVHQARLLLAYMGVDFVDKRYSRGEDLKGSDWFVKDKYALGLDFPNLPYFIDGDVKLVNSVTIQRYLGRKYSLDGTTEVEKNRIALVEQQLQDLMYAFYELALRPNYKDLSYDFLETLEKVQLKQLSDFLGKGKFVAGEQISYVDFWLYEYLVKIKMFAPEVFGKFENLKQFVDRIEALPRIAEYIQANEPLVFCGPRFAWNSKY